MFFKLNFDAADPLRQEPINRDRIDAMIRQRPRRFRLADFENSLKAPGEFSAKQTDWNLRFPFKETFVSSFKAMCSVNHIPFQSCHGPSVFTFLKDTTPEEIEEVRRWISVVSPFVAIRDCLAVSFALDYDRKGGDPKNAQTAVGALRSIAKPYDLAPTVETLNAANKLAVKCNDFLEVMTCYGSATCVVAMRPSRPDKRFDLPRYLADDISKRRDVQNLTLKVRIVASRVALKDAPIDQKLSLLEDTLVIDNDAFAGRDVLLLDDLYQSGISMNYVAMLLIEAGATKVFGLACEKTCRNDDNVGVARRWLARLRS